MTRREQRIAAIEKKLKQKESPNAVIIYDPNIPGDEDAKIAKFYKEYPGYEYPLIILPKNDRDDED